MYLPPRLRLLSSAALISAAITPAMAQMRVTRILLSTDGPFQFKVQTSAPVTPQSQVIANPFRLVIDVPGAVPGPALRNQLVNRGEVERMRVGLFTSSPPTTRIVLDLKSPQPYQVTPMPSGFTVSVGRQSVAASQPAVPTSVASSTDADPDGTKTIGWVSSAAPAVKAGTRGNSVVVRQFARDSLKANNGVSVQYSKGQLEIHARDAKLADVLFQIEQQTGADISLPPGSEQERVAGDFGPGTSSEVVAQLFDGSDLNFVIVGSPTDPNSLRSVTLTRKNGGDFTPSEPSQPMAANNQPDGVEVQPQIEPRPEDVPPAQQEAAQPPPDAAQQPQVQPEDSSAYTPQN